MAVKNKFQNDNAILFKVKCYNYKTHITSFMPTNKINKSSDTKLLCTIKLITFFMGKSL